MVICFECSQDTKHQLDALVTSGQYADHSEAIKVAIANQALLHKKLGQERSLVVNEVATNKNQPGIEDNRSARKTLAVDYTNKKIIEPMIPEIFRMTRKPEAHEAAPMPDDVWSESSGIPVERWIFGQYNKLFPMKASCRALANNFTSKKSTLALPYIAQGIATHAVELGRYLLHHDLQHGIPRDERLSTAFPIPDPVTDKSRERYAKQFVISENRSGQLSSLLVDYKFVNLTREKNPRLLLTEPGWYFALLANPVLDKQQQDPLERFSQKERDFLIEHIISYVPVERFAYRTILNSVAMGENTPEKLGTALKAYVRDVEAFTPSFLSAQRSGAISRMVDVALLIRLRDGVRVTYKRTQAGNDFLIRAQ